MSKSNYSQVVSMYRKFGFLDCDVPEAEADQPAPTIGAPRLLDSVTSNFRLKALKEELTELGKAYGNDDLAGIADALVDLVVFALGTAALHHLPWESLFEEVMRANMQKEIGQGRKARNDSNIPDLVKPAGWQSPDIHKILRRFLYHGD